MQRQDTLMVERDDSTMKEYDVLDLYDLAVLLTYERYTREPRFRHAMLIDVARGPEELQLFADVPGSGWDNPAKRHKRVGYVFKVEDIEHDENELDTPETMLPLTIVPPRVKALSAQQRDTIFWQARAHDACYASIALLQFLFKLYEPDQPVRIRLENGHEAIALLHGRLTATYTLKDPKQMVMSVVCHGEPYERAPGIMALKSGTFITGEGDSMPHCVMGFLPIVELSPPGQKTVMLDLASMQFGDAGRGLRGRTSLFVLEDMDAFRTRMDGLAELVSGPDMGGPYIPRGEEYWLEDVARRVKRRYDRRETEHWCGHCGAPANRLACTGCKAAWYCDREHQVAAWSHHKRWCAGKKK